MTTTAPFAQKLAFNAHDLATYYRDTQRIQRPDDPHRFTDRQVIEAQLDARVAYKAARLAAGIEAGES